MFSINKPIWSRHCLLHINLRLRKMHRQSCFGLVGLWVLFSFCIHTAYSQTYFSKIYNPNATWGAALSINLNDSGYLVCSLSPDTSMKSGVILLTQLDKLGNSGKSIGIGDTGIIYFPGSYGSMVKTDFGYCVGGGIDTGANALGMFLLLDSNLAIKQKTVFGDTIADIILRQSRYLSDSGYALLGQKTALGQYNMDILLIRLGKAGDVLWQKTYNFVGVDDGWSLIETPDKGFLLGGGGYVAGLKHSYSGLIIKTDSLGNEQWRKTIGSSYDDFWCVVANSPDGNFIVGTTTGVGIINNDESWRRIRLLKISPTGAVLWDKMYSEKHGSSALNNLLILPNGDIIALGSYYPANPQQTDSWSWLLKLNTHGDSLWLREHFYFNGSYNTNRLFDIKPTLDGGFITCGYVDSMPAVSQSIWVLKLDSFGCLVPGCQNVGMKEVILQDNEQVFVYPNPATTEITIKLSEQFRQNAKEARVFNNLGQEVLRQSLSAGEATHTLNIAYLSAGIYHIRIIGNGISVVAGKVVKE